jgi:hemoglobin
MTMTQGTAFIEPAVLEELDAEGKELHPESAFLAIGGASAVTAVVEEFYRRLLADPVTAPFFQQLLATDSLAALKRHQVLMLIKVLGGPDRYKGRDLSSAHAGLRITDDVYCRVSLYLLTVMHEFKVPMDILLTTDQILRSVHDLVVTAPSAAPGTQQ